MSAKSRYRNHNKNHNKNHRAAASSINTAINTSIHEISALTQHLSTASPFEEAQLQHIQTMTEHLAEQVLSTMKQKDESNPNATLPLLRVYAQYLNLYMKFKDKCFKNKVINQSSPKQTVPPSTSKPSPLPEPVLEPVSDRNHPGEDKLSGQIRNAIQKVIRKNEPSRLQPDSPVNSLLMPQPIAGK